MDQKIDESANTTKNLEQGIEEKNEKEKVILEEEEEDEELEVLKRKENLFDEKRFETLTGFFHSEQVIDNDIFPIPNDYLKAEVYRLPEYLQSKKFYVLQEDELDSHLRYAYSYLLNGQLKVYKKHYAYEKCELPEEIKYAMEAESDSPPEHRQSFIQSVPDHRQSFLIPTTQSDEKSEEVLLEQFSNFSIFRESICEPDYHPTVDKNSLNEITNRVVNTYDYRWNKDYKWKPIEENEDTCRRVFMRPPFKRKEIVEFMVKIHDLKLDHIGKIEPLFCRIALYDAKARKKISENFYFTLNTEKKVVCHFPDFPKYMMPDVARRRLKALFSVTNPNKHIYVLLWVEKILQKGGGTAEYRKQSVNEEEIRKKVSYAWEYLNNYRTPLLFSFEPLFTAVKDDKNQVTRLSIGGHNDQPGQEEVQLRTGTIEFKNIYAVFGDGKNKLNFYDMFNNPNEYLKDDKKIDGCFSMEVVEVNEEKLIEEIKEEIKLESQEDEEEKRQVPEFKPKDQRTEAEDEDVQYRLRKEFHEVFNFEPNFDGKLHLRYQHSLFLYPQSVNFSNIGINRQARNVCCKIILRDNDEIKFIRGLRNFSPRYSRTYDEHKRMDIFGVCAVTYHNKYPQFFDEIRIDLPFPLKKEHHILFEFYHVHAKPITSKDMEDISEMSMGKAQYTDVATSVVKLMEDNIIATGRHKLVCYKYLQNKYYDKLEKMETYNNGKHLFRFKTNLISSIYPNDKRAVSFLRTCHFLLEREPKKSDDTYLSSFYGSMLFPEGIDSMAELRKANWEKILPYSPAFLNLLIFIMVNCKGSSLNTSHLDSDEKKNLEENKELQRAVNVAFCTFLTLARGFCNPSINEEEKKSDNQTDRERKSVDESHRDILFRNELLMTYVQYFFDNPEKSMRPVYQMLVELWNTFIANCKNGTQDELISTQENKEKIEKKTANWTQRVRKVSIFGTLPFNMQRRSVTEETELKYKPITLEDSMRLSWFLFDIIAKSILLYAQPDRIQKRQMKNVWTSDHLIKDEAFFKNLETLLEEIIIYMFEKGSGTIDDKILANRLNSTISLFIRDLIEISFLPHLQNTQFRKNCLSLLKHYIAVSEKHKKDSLDQHIKFRLDFIEIIADSNWLIEMNSRLEKQSLVLFILDITMNCMYEPQYRRRAIEIIYNLLNRFDYSKKYQSDDQRDSIAKMFLPFLVKLIKEQNILELEDEEREKDYNQTTGPTQPSQSLEICYVCIVHILRNLKKEEKERFLKEKNSTFLANFIKLLSKVILALMNHKIGTFRRIAKLVCLDVFNQFVTVLKDRLIKENDIDVLTECVSFMVTFLDSNRKDKDISEILFLPSFNDFLTMFLPIIIGEDEKQTLLWKWSIGILLKFCDIPISETKIKKVTEALQMLMRPFIEQMKDIEVEAFRLVKDSEENIVFDEKDNSIKGATIDKLVERVTYDKDMELKFKEVFFLTYRSFTKPIIVLDKLIKRFRLADETKRKLEETKKTLGVEKLEETKRNLENQIKREEKITLRVLSAIKLWVDKHFYDFDNLLVTRLITFLDEEVAKVEQLLSFCKNLKKVLSQKLISNDAKVDLKVMFSTKPPKSITPKHFFKKEFRLLDWSSTEIARQMTLIEASYFKKIQPKECLSGAWGKPHRKYKEAPNIAHLTDRWNLTADFVSSTILKFPELRHRKQYMCKFIEIAAELRKLNNFNGVTEIISGLQQQSIHRLRRTWESLPSDVMQTFKELEELVDAKQSYKAMRAALIKATPPCIPPMHMYLKDLIFIIDGNPDNLKNSLINFYKRRQISKVIIKMKEYQQAPYNLKEVKYLQNIINNELLVPKNLLTDDEMWERSNKFEPKR